MSYLLCMLLCPHTNGLDYRRVSLSKPGQFNRCSSARFKRQQPQPQFSSVVGAIGPPSTRPLFFNSNHNEELSMLKRSKSDRFQSSRPQWKPPGSPTAVLNNQ
ncbi:unnamed protein product, partial [Echinostoma caproni]|uniref:Secreted protein n=1 Tax=Echinostoma caproni TaxID=27848 RepID=A0A183BA48_9TREM